jgi:hypothetical protein
LEALGWIPRRAGCIEGLQGREKLWRYVEIKVEKGVVSEANGNHCASSDTRGSNIKWEWIAYNNPE